MKKEKVLLITVLFSVAILVIKSYMRTPDLTGLAILLLLLILSVKWMVRPNLREDYLEGIREEAEETDRAIIEEVSLSRENTLICKENEILTNLESDQSGNNEFAFEINSTILYLRSFSTDTDIDVQSIGDAIAVVETYEYLFRKHLRGLGFLVTFSNNDVDYLGGTKLPIQEHEWKISFKKHINKSTHILWSWGVTESLLWELSQLLNQRYLNRLIIFFPVDGLSPASRELIWHKTLQKLVSIGADISSLPPNIGDAYFLRFENGKCRMVNAKQNLFDKILTQNQQDNFIISLKNLVRQMDYSLDSFKSVERVYYVIMVVHVYVILMFSLFFDGIWVILSIMGYLLFLFLVITFVARRVKASWTNKEKFAKQILMKIVEN